MKKSKTRLAGGRQAEDDGGTEGRRHAGAKACRGEGMPPPVMCPLDMHTRRASLMRKCEHALVCPSHPDRTSIVCGTGVLIEIDDHGLWTGAGGGTV